MKIETSIAPRRDHTVTLVCPSGAKYVFTNDGSGTLLCEVTEEADLTFMLALGDFCPVDAEDIPQVVELLRETAGTDDLPDDDGDENAAPIEVVTAPKPAKPKAKR